MTTPAASSPAPSPAASPRRPLAVVTGGNGGIGLAFAHELARDGHDLLITGRDTGRLDEAGRALAAAGAKVETAAVDLADPQALADFAARLAALSPDILVNNAGFGGYGPFARTDAAHEMAMIATNVTALTLLTKAVLPGMLARGSGRILNVASTAAFAPGANSAVYGATKAYVLSLSEAIAEEVSGSGVSVTALCPGPVPTRFAARAGMSFTRIFKGPTLSAEEVARQGYVGLMAGHRLVVPGLSNKVLVFAVRLLPRSLVTRVSRRALEEEPARQTHQSA